MSELETPQPEDGEHDLYTILRKVRYDLTAAQAKLTDAFNTMAAMKLPAPAGVVCPSCSGHFKTKLALAEHRYTMHGLGAICLACGYVLEDGHVCRVEAEPETEAQPVT